MDGKIRQHVLERILTTRQTPMPRSLASLLQKGDKVICNHFNMTITLNDPMNASFVFENGSIAGYEDVAPMGTIDKNMVDFLNDILVTETPSTSVKVSKKRQPSPNKPKELVQKSLRNPL